MAYSETQPGQRRISDGMLQDLDELIELSNQVCTLAADRLKPIMSNPQSEDAKSPGIPVLSWPPLFDNVRVRVAQVRHNLHTLQAALLLCET